jgi:hypothetical protein
MLDVRLPPVAVTVNDPDRFNAVLLAVRINLLVPLPGHAITDGVKLAVVPEGSLLILRVTAAANPPDDCVVIVSHEELPVLRFIALALALALRVAGASTVMGSVRICLSGPLVPLSVSV